MFGDVMKFSEIDVGLHGRELIWERPWCSLNPL